MTWDPDRYLTYADERGRPFVDLVARIDADRPRTRGRPRLRPRQPHPAARRTLARRGDRRTRQQSRDDRQGAEDADRHRLRGRRPPRLVSRASRSTCSSPTPRSSGCPTTSTSCRDSSRPWPRAAGWPSRCRATSTSPATRSCVSSRPSRRTPTTPVASSGPAATAPRSTSAPSPSSDCAVDAWETTYLHVLPGRRPRLHLDLLHRRPAGAAGAAARPARAFTEEFKRRLRAAYPHHEHGVVLPFRRIFAVARTAA